MVKTRMVSAKGARGFTLIELMIAIAIMGILAAIAVPSLSKYIRESRRAQAQADMLQIRLALEKWRANNNSYLSTLNHADDATILTPADLADNLSTANAYYDYALLNTSAGGTPDASHYYIRATAVGGQAADVAGGVTSCTPMGLDQSGAKTHAACWKK